MAVTVRSLQVLWMQHTRLQTSQENLFHTELQTCIMTSDFPTGSSLPSPVFTAQVSDLKVFSADVSALKLSPSSKFQDFTEWEFMMQKSCTMYIHKNDKNTTDSQKTFYNEYQLQWISKSWSCFCLHKKIKSLQIRVNLCFTAIHQWVRRQAKHINLI